MTETRRGMTLGLDALPEPVEPAPKHGHVTWRRYHDLCRERGLEPGGLRIYLDGVDVTMDVYGFTGFHDIAGWVDLIVRGPGAMDDVVRHHGQVELRTL